MMYFKSVLAGIAAVLAVLGLAIVAILALPLVSLMSEADTGSGGIGAVSFGFGLPHLVVALAAFAGGFYWEFRRASRARP